MKNRSNVISAFLGSMLTYPNSAKEVCQIIIRDAYNSLCTKENILGLQTTEPPGQSVEPPHSAHLESSNQNRKHHIYMNRHHIVMEC